MSSSTDPTTTAETTGANLRFSLACPQCGTIGWLKWSSLKFRIGCPKCQCSFLMGRNGRLKNWADLPQIHYKCPRCGEAGSLPEQLAVRGVACSACKLPLTPGHNRQLPAAKRDAELPRSIAVKSAHVLSPGSKANRWNGLLEKDSRLPALRAALVAVVVCLAIGGYTIIAPWFDTSLDTTARRFTRACLAGDWNDAHRFMQDDALQVSQFDRWRVRYFSSILDAYRPKGDKVTVTAETLEENPRACVLKITLMSPSIGTRSHRQLWEFADGIWRFDAHATVSEIP